MKITRNDDEQAIPETFTVTNQKLLVKEPISDEYGKTISITTPDAITKHCKDMSQYAEEAFHILTLNTRNTVIRRWEVSTGTINSSIVHPREIFRRAIADGAAAIILVHNHPSGDPTPSAEDLRVTRRVIEAGKILDIKVLDHVVIGQGQNPICSMRENGLLEF